MIFGLGLAMLLAAQQTPCADYVRRALAPAREQGLYTSALERALIHELETSGGPGCFDDSED